MKFKIITIGKVKDKSVKFQIEEIKKRIARIEIVELKEVKDKNVSVVKDKEYGLIKEHLSSSNFNILLLEKGKEFSSEELYLKFKGEGKTLCFIVTGAFGPSEKLLGEVDFVLSLSKLTFTHEVAQFLLVEQIYRMQCFEKNIPYTK